MKLFVVLATLLVVASVAQSASVRRISHADEEDVQGDFEEVELPRKFFGNLDSLKEKISLGGDKFGQDKEIIVVYVKDDNTNSNKNKNKWSSSVEYTGDYDSALTYKKPVRKIRPVKWESYEDEDDYEYVRPIKTTKTKVKPVYVSGTTTTTTTSNLGDKFGSSSWSNWLSEKLASKFHKGTSSNDDEEIIVIKKPSGGSSSSSSSGNKWDKLSQWNKWGKFE